MLKITLRGAGKLLCASPTQVEPLLKMPRSKLFISGFLHIRIGRAGFPSEESSRPELPSLNPPGFGRFRQPHAGGGHRVEEARRARAREAFGRGCRAQSWRSVFSMAAKADA